jgi:hypothetical protein
MATKWRSFGFTTPQVLLDDVADREVDGLAGLGEGDAVRRCSSRLDLQHLAGDHEAVGLGGDLRAVAGREVLRLHPHQDRLGARSGLHGDSAGAAVGAQQVADRGVRPEVEGLRRLGAELHLHGVRRAAGVGRLEDLAEREEGRGVGVGGAPAVVAAKGVIRASMRSWSFGFLPSLRATARVTSATVRVSLGRMRPLRAEALVCNPP